MAGAFAGRKLDDIMKLDTVKDKTPMEICALWSEFHKKHPRKLGFFMAQEEFAKVHERTKECSFFAFPIFGKTEETKDQYFVVVANSNPELNSCLFTGLHEYQKLGENALPYMIVTHYTELMDDKGITLCAAEIMSEAHIDKTEAARLVHLLGIYYSDTELFEKFVREFNTDPKFDWEGYKDALVEMETQEKVRIKTMLDAETEAEAEAETAPANSAETETETETAPADNSTETETAKSK